MPVSMCPTTIPSPVMPSSFHTRSASMYFTLQTVSAAAVVFPAAPGAAIPLAASVSLKILSSCITAASGSRARASITAGVAAKATAPAR